MSDKARMPVDRRLCIRLFIISFASLFWELFLIRWVTSEMPFLGYFRSLVLLAAFFGMGLGCMLYRRIRLSDGALINIFLAGVYCIFLIMFMAGSDLRQRGFGGAAGEAKPEGIWWLSGHLSWSLSCLCRSV